MKRYWMVAAVGLGVSICASAHAAIKPCNDLKAEIAKKLDAKGVTHYTLSIVQKGQEANGKVVGSCDAGTRSILYSKAKSGDQPKPAAEQPKHK